jgi:hypothetical protein
VKINEELLERKVAAPVQSPTSGGHQSVYFACGLKATEVVIIIIIIIIIIIELFKSCYNTSTQ